MLKNKRRFFSSWEILLREASKITIGDVSMFSARGNRGFQDANPSRIVKDSIWETMTGESIKVIGSVSMSISKGNLLECILFTSTKFTDTTHILSEKDFLTKYSPKRVFEYYWRFVNFTHYAISYSSIGVFNIYSEKMTEEEAKKMMDDKNMFLVKVEGTETERVSK